LQKPTVPFAAPLVDGATKRETYEMAITKAKLTKQDRWKRGGSMVRVAPTFLAGQRERDARLHAALGLRPDDVHPRNRYTDDTVFVVVDDYVRRGVDTKPDGVGVSVPGSGLAFNVPVAAIREVVA
jgi:hypothetical protein